MENISISFRIEKATATGRYVSGWLSVVQKDGKRVEDTQGDLISMVELQKGVHKYMRGSRVIKKQHSGDQIGEMVEIVMIDDDFAKAHGITHTKRGAWGTAEITDEATRESVRKGEVQGWSMGGKGKRTPIEKASVFRGGSLVARKRLQRLSVQNSPRAAAGDRGAISRGRKIGTAQAYLTRRLARQGHVFKSRDPLADLARVIDRAAALID